MTFQSIWADTVTITRTQQMPPWGIEFVGISIRYECNNQAVLCQQLAYLGLICPLELVI